MVHELFVSYAVQLISYIFERNASWASILREGSSDYVGKLLLGDDRLVEVDVRRFARRFNYLFRFLDKSEPKTKSFLERTSLKHFEIINKLFEPEFNSPSFKTAESNSVHVE
jgi:hypothetical protein